MLTLSRRSPHWIALLMILLSLGAKLTVWQSVRQSDPTRFLRPDSVGYIDSALALVETGRFAVSPAQPDVPQLFRTPGYPAFLAVIYRLTGQAEPALFALAQILLSLVAMGLAYWLAYRLWHGTVAVVALGLLAFDLPAFAYSLFVMSETLFTVCLLSGLLTLRQVDMGNTGGHGRWLALAGLALGLATLVRPVSYYWVIPLSLWVLGVSWQRKRSWRTTLIELVCLLAPCGLLVGGWQWHNYQVSGNPTISTVVANNLLLYRGAGVLALRDSVPIETVQEALKKNLAGKEGQALYQYMEEEGLTLLRRYPGLAVQTQVRGALTMMFGLGDGWLTMLLHAEPTAGSAAWDLLRYPVGDYVQEWLRDRPIPFVAFWEAALQVGLTYIGIGCWWLLLLRKKQCLRNMDVLLWLTLFYFIAVSAGPEANSRFRVPLAPLLTGYAALGYYGLLVQRDGSRFWGETSK